MDEVNNSRPDPQDLLEALQREEQDAHRGKLKIFFGMCAGVGKTYDMLKAAQIQKSKGVDVVVGWVETHGRKETESLLEGLTALPRRRVEYKGTHIDEMDLDAVLARKPALVLVDELAHTNAHGSRHTRRYQDVLEILDSGIDVYSTLNVQHLESRADTVAQISGAIVRETVPDSIFEAAAEVELVDIPPDELLKRLEEGKVYTPERSRPAMQNFFRKGNLTALREMALRLTAERVDHQLRELMRSQKIATPVKSGQRLLVAISSSPNSISLIRWARRAAYAMDATWVAAYVEASRALSKGVREQLARNIALARELGAEIVTTADEDIAKGILRVTREQSATQLLVGKTSSVVFWRKSLLDRLIELSGDLDVVVVGRPDKAGRARRFHLPPPQSPLAQYALAATIAVVLSAAFFPLKEILGYQTISLLLLFAVALLSLRFGTGPVVLAAGCTALLWNFLFIPPRFTFSIGQPQDVVMFFAYFVIAAITGVLTSRIRSRERIVRAREQHAVALYTLTRELSIANSIDDVVEVAVKNFKKFFDADVVICLSESDGDMFTKPHPASSLHIEPKEFNVAAWVYWNERKAGRFTETLPFAEATYFPCSGPRYPLGVIGVKVAENERPSLDQETLIENFIGQISSSLEREQLNELARKSLVIAESEKLYKTLFDSISHEFKTPIATILGTTEYLLNSELIKDEASSEGVQDIREAAVRLNRLVANLLDMTRLESGLLKPRLDWCDLSDLIQGSVHKCEEELSHHHVRVDVDTSLPPVLLDFGLMEQVFTNLLVNAAVHTPAGSHVDISAKIENDRCIILVCDDGPGVPAEVADKVFQKFYRLPGSRTGGTGLGLSIVRGFVEAHDGKITVSNRETGGACFTLTFPTGDHDGRVNA
ncbi:MAG: sensor histidine kinase KdpD [Ignavibacteriae bacterium]|nr:sensor histidine kinase KdpD [Ignavibacteriota bacterium]